ncbi:hypothetical protein AWJ07_02870 [Shewanella frigidimarina]|uniref:Nitroreductase domain-containing protein n=2 Tax=Shewanella frigidimarina TaxID=56812 RepID=A0A106C3E7_SHEFR|nr:hypothetical protein AWJ07_02870 [Shewanella frigidimarina]
MNNTLVNHVRRLVSRFVSRKKVELFIISICSKYRVTSSLYYLLFNRGFRREHQAILLGRLQYQRSLNNIEHSSVLLRRNIHRLEKGLIMVPRKPVFATSFIAETVNVYALAVAQGFLGSSEAQWANDVLCEYFAVVGTDATVDKARVIFEQVRAKDATNSVSSLTPYTHAEIVNSGVSATQLSLLFKQRRSVRWYQDKPVEIEKINIAVDMASQAPSACNRQPFKLHVVINKDTVKQVAECAMGTKGFADNIPMIIAVVGDLSSYPLERDRHLIYIDGALMAMQFMLALETLGLSSCPLNWPEIETQERMLDNLLQFTPYERTVMLIAVGYASPTGGIPFSQKKTSASLIKIVD